MEEEDEEDEDFRWKMGTKYIKEEERLWKVRSLSISMREKGIEWSKRKKEDERLDVREAAGQHRRE